MGGYVIMKMYKFVMPEIIFGSGSITQVGESCLRLGAQKVFIITDPGIITAGWLEPIIDSCQKAGLSYAIFSDLTTNPKDYEVERGVQQYLVAECDAIVGIGGGSAIDVAKAIALVATNGGKIHDYEGVDKINRPLPPLVMIPTTAGSGSEVSQFSIILNSEHKIKMSIVSKSLIPDIAIIDPETLVTKDSLLTATTGLDVLTHGIEAFVSIAATPLTDVHALHSIQLVTNYLRPSVASKANIEAKEKMAMASLQAGLAFSNAILGAVHAMSHAIGGRFLLPHGEVNAILLPHVIEYNYISAPEKFLQIAQILYPHKEDISIVNARDLIVEYVRKLSEEIGAPQRLRHFGLSEEDADVISRYAIADACMITNPRDLTVEDIKTIFLHAL